MFSALRQGSIVYILERDNGLKCSTGKVVSTTSPQFNGINSFVGTIHITVDMGDGTREFGNIPTDQNVVYYNNGKTILSENRDAIINEVSNVVQDAKNTIANISNIEKIIKDGEDILKDYNPMFAKEKAREEEMNALKDYIKGVDNKLDQLIAAMSRGVNN